MYVKPVLPDGTPAQRGCDLYPGPGGRGPRPGGPSHRQGLHPGGPHRQRSQEQQQQRLLRVG